MNDLKQKMLQKIKSGEVAMRPRWYFILHTTLIISGTLILLFSSIYLLSFIAFTLKRTGLLLAPGFGIKGVLTFLTFSPWLLIFFVLIFFLSLEILVRHYSFGYRHPLLYSMGGIILVSFGGAIAVLQIPIHESIEHGHFPGVSSFYERYAGHRPNDMYIGKLVSYDESAMFFAPDEGDNFIVHISNRTKLPPSEQLEIGETFLIFGNIADGEINALGIKPFEVEIPLLHENRPPPRLQLRPQIAP